MTTISWTQTTSGSWTTGAAWSSGAAPLRGDDVTISPGASITVTYATISAVLDSLTTGAGDTLDITSGTLATANGYEFLGALQIGGGLVRLAGGAFGNFIDSNLTMSGGTLQFDNSAVALNGILNQAAGTINIAHGIFTDEDTGNLLGTIAGAGEWLLNQSTQTGSTVLQSGFVLSAGSVEIANATVVLGLNETLDYGKIFTITQQGTLNLNGNAATLSGISTLDGDVRGGNLLLDGTGHLDGLLLDNGAQATITSITGTSGSGTYNQTGQIVLGSSSGTGTLSVQAGGLLRITGNDSIYLGSAGGTLSNAGTIEKTAGSSFAGQTVIYTEINNAGTIDVAAGTIDFSGPGGGTASNIGGTLMGVGTIDFSNGYYVFSNETLNNARTLFNGSVNATLASALTYGGNWDQTGGLILVENALTLTGLTALDGGEMKGVATVTVGPEGGLQLGAGMDLEGNLTFALDSNVNQTGAITFGYLSDSIDQATIATGTTWALEGASDISGAYGTITNNGIFEKSSGATDAIVQSNLDNASTGSIIANSGTLSLSGQGTLGGSISGSAVLDISGAFGLEAGLSITVGELILDAPAQNNDVQATLFANQTYSHDFAMEGGTLALDGNGTTNGNTLTLSGVTSLGGGAIIGSGEVIVNAAATIGSLGTLALAQGADLLLNGATQQFADIIMTGGSTAPVLTIEAGASLTVNDGLLIGGLQNGVPTSVGTVTVDGTLNAHGNATIAAAVNNTGTITLSHGEIAFLGPLSGAGILDISAGAVLDLDNSNLTSSGITFGVGGGELYLQSPSDYMGTIAGFSTGDAVELGGFAYIGATLTVTGHSATISEMNGSSMTLHFSNAQTATTLQLGVGSHGGVALMHL